MHVRMRAPRRGEGRGRGGTAAAATKTTTATAGARKDLAGGKRRNENRRTGAHGRAGRTDTG